MRRLTIAVASLLLPFAAAAQQAPPLPQDYTLSFYRQLLTEANDRLATMSARVQMLEAQIAAAAAAAKKDADAAAKEKKPAE